MDLNQKGVNTSTKLEVIRHIKNKNRNDEAFYEDMLNQATIYESIKNKNNLNNDQNFQVPLVDALEDPAAIQGAFDLNLPLFEVFEAQANVQDAFEFKEPEAFEAQAANLMQPLFNLNEIHFINQIRDLKPLTVLEAANPRVNEAAALLGDGIPDENPMFLVREDPFNNLDWVYALGEELAPEEAYIIKQLHLVAPPALPPVPSLPNDILHECNEIVDQQNGVDTLREQRRNFITSTLTSFGGWVIKTVAIKSVFSLIPVIIQGAAEIAAGSISRTSITAAPPLSTPPVLVPPMVLNPNIQLNLDLLNLIFSGEPTLFDLFI